MVVAYSRYYPDGTENAMKISVGIAVVSGKVRTQYVPNTFLERHHSETSCSMVEEVRTTCSCVQKIEVGDSSETSVHIYRATRCFVAEQIQDNYEQQRSNLDASPGTDICS